jgi:hypothetical protein
MLMSHAARSDAHPPYGYRFHLCLKPNGYQAFINVLCIILILSASGCVSIQKRKVFAESFQSYGVSAVVQEKVGRGKDLTIEDIKNLVKRNVPDESIIEYLKYSQKTYTLQVREIEQMQQNGFSEELINFIISTPTLYSREIHPPFYPAHPHYYYGPYPYHPQGIYSRHW